MKNISRSIAVIFFCALAALPSFANSIPVRGSSQNGVDSDAPFWNLMGPTSPNVRNNGAVSVETEIVCTNQQVAAAVDNTDSADAGTCIDGNYTFLFQIQTTAPSLKISLTDLVGFTPFVSGNGSSYGVAICDNDPNNPQASNTLQLCSTVTGVDLSSITATVNKKNTIIRIGVPSVPSFPAGVGKQGQGLTLVVVTSQGAGHPVSVPKINISTN
jgi:hypothetical protein